MSVRAIRTILLAIWFVAFGLSLGIVIFLGMDGRIGQDNYHSALTQLNSSYVPYLGVIIAFYFASNALEKDVKHSNVAAALALIASLIWNVVVLSLFVPLLYGHGTIEQSTRETEFVCGLISWLVAPAIGFYFAKSPVAKASG